MRWSSKWEYFLQGWTWTKYVRNHHLEWMEWVIPFFFGAKMFESTTGWIKVIPFFAWMYGTGSNRNINLGWRLILEQTLRSSLSVCKLETRPIDLFRSWSHNTLTKYREWDQISILVSTTLILVAQNFARHSLDVLNELALRTCNRSNNCPLRKKSKLRAAKKQTPNQYSISVYIYIYTHDIHVSQFLKPLSYSASTNNKFNKKNLPSSLSFTTIYWHHICHHHTKISPPTNGHVSARPTAVCSTAAVKNHCKWLNFVTQTFGINQKTWWDDSTSQSGEFQLNLFCYIIHDDFKNLKKLLDILERGVLNNKNWLSGGYSPTMWFPVSSFARAMLQPKKGCDPTRQWCDPRGPWSSREKKQSNLGWIRASCQHELYSHSLEDSSINTCSLLWG